MALSPTSTTGASPAIADDAPGLEVLGRVLPGPVDELDAAGVLARCGQALLERRAAEVADLRLVQQWAVLHSTDPEQDPEALAGDKLVPVGADGTPWVRELCLGELALARQVGWSTARAAMAAVLDLAHRFPRVWTQVTGLAAEAWVARRVTVIARELALEDCGPVDAAVARVIASEAPSRVFEIAQAKVIEADPARHAAKVARERARRYVSLSRTDEAGLRFVVGRIQAGDAAYLDAMLDRVADILSHHHDLRQQDRQRIGLPVQLAPSRDVLRAEALGWLSRPAELLRLLLEHAEDAVDDEPPSPDDEPPVPHPPVPHPTPSSAPTQDPLRSSRTTAFPADLLAALASIDPARLRPRATVYVHLTDATLADPARGTARVEECGPMLATQLIGLLRHSHVTLRPVLDLAEEVASCAYEHPEDVRERVWLRNGRDTFPFATATSRRVDLDHPVPYDPGGPPDQTGTHNSQPLGRRHHRWKTHQRGVRVRQVAPATYLWRTPHGLHYLVSPTGSHPVSPAEASQILGTAAASRPSDTTSGSDVA